MNRKLLLILIVSTLILTSCSSGDSKSDVDQKLQEEQIKLEQEKEQLETAREQVVSKFKNQREVLGTGKFIEDMYNKYKEDEVIKTIYNYHSAIQCIDFYNVTGELEWWDKAIAYASKISPSYDDVLHEEIIDFVTKFLGDDWERLSQEILIEEEKIENLTMEDKKEIYKYIQERVSFYDNKDGGNTGDKYADVIWKETSEKFDIKEYTVTDIWTDLNVIEAVGKDNAKDN